MYTRIVFHFEKRSTKKQSFKQDSFSFFHIKQQSRQGEMALLSTHLLCGPRLQCLGWQLGLLLVCPQLQQQDGRRDREGARGTQLSFKESSRSCYIILSPSPLQQKLGNNLFFSGQLSAQSKNQGFYYNRRKENTCEVTSNREIIVSAQQSFIFRIHRSFKLRGFIFNSERKKKQAIIKEHKGESNNTTHVLYAGN